MNTSCNMVTKKSSQFKVEMENQKQFEERLEKNGIQIQNSR